MELVKNDLQVVKGLKQLKDAPTTGWWLKK